MTVLVKKHIPTGTIVLNRPERRNALSRQMMTELAQALSDMHGEKQVRAVVLTGSGNSFCSGMDLHEMQEHSKSERPHDEYHDDAVQYCELLEQMLRFPKPIIAAVNGPVMAGGMGLVLASDVVIAASEATFGLPEPRRGLVAGMVSPLLAFRLGASHAARLLLTAESVSASEAYRMGLVADITVFDLLWARAHDLSQKIALSAPQAIQLTKRMLNETIGEHLGTLLAAGAAASATARTTDAATEGLAAFLEKRAPQWS